MTLSMPLTVRVVTSRVDSDITAQVRDLTFRSQIPGGFASASFTLTRPLDITPSDIEYYASVYVYDARNGNTVWEGRLEDPGRTAGSDGETWAITAMGPSAHAQDRTYPIIFLDSLLDLWKRSHYSSKNAYMDTSQADPVVTGIDDLECLTVHANEGSPVTTSWAGDWIYRQIHYANQKLGRVRAGHVEGGASANYSVTIVNRVGYGTSPGAIDANNWAVTPQILSGTPSSTNWTLSDDVTSIRVARNISNTTANDLAWCDIFTTRIRSLLKNPDGSDITAGSAYTLNVIQPVDVVGDLLGRYLTKYDGANATLVDSGVPIYHLRYPDGTTASQIFDDLAVFDPQYYWAAWETNPATGKWRFEYRGWPTTVRYEADTFDGFDSPGSADDLYNEVCVRYLNEHGTVITTRVTQTVQVLADAGLTRCAYLDVSDEIGSPENASHIGTNFLLEHQTPPNAGTLTVARPILDLDTGRMIQPWEIRPGNLIRVRGVLPRIDALNPVDRDGVTVFRVISMEYSASTAAATLELDSYARSITRAVKDALNKRIRKR
jgi:hypothetical protein